jgi:polysaccharide chain length determinant protein (PEP-CTERM system associated)
MSTEYQLTFNDYISILRRRGPLLVATFVGLLAAALVVVVAIPPVYQSTGTIMVESQTIPTDLIPSSAASLVDERIEVIRQRVMTRANLFKIIEKHGLFKDSTQSLTVSEKIDEMRRQIAIESIGANLKSRRQGQGTIAFRLSFEHRKPEITQRVANELVTLFLDENVKSRTERATETTEFLTQEADKLKVELEKVETQLAAYKQEHSKALPQHQQLHMGMLSRTETELKDVEREYKTAQEELRFLDLELSAAKAGITAKTGAAYAPQNPQDIGSLKAEYQRLLSLYTEAHPDVRAVKRKIEALESAAPAAGATGAEKPAAAPVSLEVARVQAKIAATNSRMESLAGQIKTLRGKIGSYEQQLLQIPQVERGLVTLMRDHESAQKKYGEIHAKQMSAKIAENLEGENKAERFSLLEPPAYPDKPSKPDRVKILLIGIFAALGGSGGLVFLLEMLNQRIRGQEALAIAIRQRPMLVIPYIFIEDEVLGRKRLLKIVVIVATAVIVISATLLHFFYMPLDLLMMKIIARFG